MIISDFCKGRNVDPQAIRKYVQRHPEEFQGHTSKKGKEIELDPIAVEILEKKYPFPISILNGVTHEEHNLVLKQLAESQNVIIALQEELRKQTVLIAQAEAKQILLEEREKQLEELKAETKELKEENEALRGRTFWDYLLRRQ